jgi:hypothetical protein
MYKATVVVLAMLQELRVGGLPPNDMRVVCGLARSGDSRNRLEIRPEVLRLHMAIIPAHPHPTLAPLGIALVLHSHSVHARPLVGRRPDQRVGPAAPSSWRESV